MISAIAIAEKYNFPPPHELVEMLGLKIVHRENITVPGVKVFAELDGDEIIIYQDSIGMDEDLLVLHEIYHYISGNNWLESESKADIWASEYIRIIRK